MTSWSALASGNQIDKIQLFIIYKLFSSEGHKGLNELDFSNMIHTQCQKRGVENITGLVCDNSCIKKKKKGKKIQKPAAF